MKLKPIASAVQSTLIKKLTYSFGDEHATEMKAHMESVARLDIASAIRQMTRELRDESNTVRYTHGGRMQGKSHAAKIYLEQFGSRITKRSNHYIISMDEAT